MKINWELEEAVVLMDLYLKKQDYRKISDEDLMYLRKFYLNRAKILNLNYDIKFRNIHGLKMQLEGIHHIVMDGREGLSNVGKVFYQALDLYKFNQKGFYKYVHDFYDKYSDEKVYKNDIKNNVNGLSCAFIEQLNALRKSSSASIDNTEFFDEFKEYMHVVRNVEIDLKNKLRSINDSCKKTLVLLCGSAGDGKSHLLSYLKNSDSEKLLDNYVVYNDATESNSPTKTAIETLSEVLLGFKDKNLNEPGKNAILAINLGVLNNFIESEYSKDFNELKEYVNKSCILSSSVSESNEYNGSFQHVSFSDYHLFTLTENGIKSDFIENLMDKVFGKNDENPFYKKYCEQNINCPMNNKCPVKHNYEFLMKKRVQKYVSDLLIEAIIKDKEILTTREILNFIYDLIVPQNFSYTKLCKNTKKYHNDINLYLDDLTPTLLFESIDVSKLMTELSKYDPLLIREEKFDDDTVSYFVSEKSMDQIKGVLEKTSYGNMIVNESNAKCIENKSLKMEIYKLFFRINSILNGKTQYENDPLFKEYLLNLYYFNINKKNKLEKLYALVSNSIYKWAGEVTNLSTESLICLNNSNKKEYILYEKLSYKPDLSFFGNLKNDDELNIFSTIMSLNFNSNNKLIELNVDYSLYCLIVKLNKGYVPTINDKNNHADFISFVDKIIKTSSNKDEIFIVREEKGFKLEKTDFGNYVFKRVK